MTDAEYIAHEFKRVGPLTSERDFRLKVTGPDGETRWLSVTGDQVHAIQRVLAETGE